MAIEPETLWLAPTRPAMQFGVPYEAFQFNLYATLAVSVILGGNPAYYLLGFFFHFVVIRPLSAWNLFFFRILRLWHKTKGAGVGFDQFGAPALSSMTSSRATNPDRMQICV